MRENDLYKEVSKKVMPDFDEMKNNAIVSAETKKRNFKPYITVAACLVAVVAAVAVSQNLRSTPGSDLPLSQNAVIVGDSQSGTTPALTQQATTQPEYKDKIVYNKLGAVGSASLAASCKDAPYALAQHKDIISAIPERINEAHYYELYVVPEEMMGTTALQNEENYTELHTTQLNFYIPNSATKILISYSEKGAPLRDYIVESGKRKSNISGVDVILNGKPDVMCIATFSLSDEYKTVYFDIEFSQVTEEEMVTVLKAVIKSFNNNNIQSYPATEPPESAETYTPSEIFSQAHEPTETTQGYFVDIDEEEDLLLGDVETMPPYNPAAD